MRGEENELPHDVIVFCRALFGDEAKADTIDERVFYQRSIAEPHAATFIDDLATKTRISGISIDATATEQRISLPATQMAKAVCAATWGGFAEEINNLLNLDDWQVIVHDTNAIKNCDLENVIDFLNQETPPNQQAFLEDGQLHMSNEHLNDLMHAWNRHQCHIQAQTELDVKHTDLESFFDAGFPANLRTSPADALLARSPNNVVYPNFNQDRNEPTRQSEGAVVPFPQDRPR